MEQIKIEEIRDLFVGSNPPNDVAIRELIKSAKEIFSDVDVIQDVKDITSILTIDCRHWLKFLRLVKKYLGNVELQLALSIAIVVLVELEVDDGLPF